MALYCRMVIHVYVVLPNVKQLKYVLYFFAVLHTLDSAVKLQLLLLH